MMVHATPHTSEEGEYRPAAATSGQGTCAGGCSGSRCFKAGRLSHEFDTLPELFVLNQLATENVRLVTVTREK